MAGFLTNTLSIIGKTIQNKPHYFLASTQLEIVRKYNGKHVNPKFKKERKLKVNKIELPNLGDQTEFSKEELRTLYKSRGLYPLTPRVERSFTLACTGEIFEAYVPPEGDGKFSAITTTGMKQNVTTFGKKTTSMLTIRKIKNFLDEFTTKEFLDEARDIYIKAHEAMAEKDFEKMRDYVTEKVYMEMKHNLVNKQIQWNFLESLEPARLVRARNTSVTSKDNVYSQLTVRFHTKQSLAIYDRFGRLMHGSKFVPKDVLEYIVFERHLANEYGTWRIHGKIIPPWMPPRDPIVVTHVEPPKPVETKKAESTSAVSKVETVEIQPQSPPSAPVQ